MDTAGAESLDTGTAVGSVPVPETEPAGGPSIGVPSIPPVGGRTLPPSPVPSVATPGAATADDPTDAAVAPDVAADDRATAGVGAPDATDVGQAAADRIVEPVAPVVPLAPVPPVRSGPDGFPAGVSEQLRWYVYLLVDPRTGRPFYVGRGRGDRCFRHVQAARAAEPPDDPQSEYPALDRIREAESSGREVRVDILRHGLKGSEARLVESAAADVLGLGGDRDDPGRRGPATEVGARLAKRAKFKHPHQVVLLRVGPTGSDPSYEAVRHHWRIGRRWIDPDSPRSPRWAVVVAGDLVVNVYRIEAWEPSGGARAGTSVGAVDRYSFVGAPDDELEQRYRGRSVAAYFGEGPPAQVTYVWCGPHWVNVPR